MTKIAFSNWSRWVSYRVVELALIALSVGVPHETSAARWERCG